LHEQVINEYTGAHVLALRYYSASIKPPAAIKAPVKGPLVTTAAAAPESLLVEDDALTLVVDEALPLSPSDVDGAEEL